MRFKRKKLFSLIQQVVVCNIMDIMEYFYIAMWFLCMLKATVCLMEKGAPYLLLISNDIAVSVNSWCATMQRVAFWILRMLCWLQHLQHVDDDDWMLFKILPQTQYSHISRILFVTLCNNIHPTSCSSWGLQTLCVLNASSSVFVRE